MGFCKEFRKKLITELLTEWLKGGDDSVWDSVLRRDYNEK